MVYVLGVGPALRYSFATSWAESVRAIYRPVRLGLGPFPFRFWGGNDCMT